MPDTAESEIARFLRCGESEHWFGAWPGDDFFARARSGDTTLRERLIAEVMRRAPAVSIPPEFAFLDLPGLARRKIAPMVRGLFPANERDTVLSVLVAAVIFLTPERIDEVLRTTPYRSTAWVLANLYLLSAGSEPLSEEAPRIVGYSEGTTCFVSMDYFRSAEPLSDFIVHEAAHVFHNCKRETIGLPFTRRREWLLEIAFGKRETFAYCCEAYSQLLELADSAASRRRLLEEHAAGPMPPDESVDPDDYLQILRSAISARNGWKRILEACAPRRRP